MTMFLIVAGVVALLVLAGVLLELAAGDPPAPPAPPRAEPLDYSYLLALRHELDYARGRDGAIRQIRVTPVTPKGVVMVLPWCPPTGRLEDGHGAEEITIHPDDWLRIRNELPTVLTAGGHVALYGIPVLQ
jgi:hypothetical protein